MARLCKMHSVGMVKLFLHPGLWIEAVANHKAFQLSAQDMFNYEAMIGQIILVLCSAAVRVQLPRPSTKATPSMQSSVWLRILLRDGRSCGWPPSPWFHAEGGNSPGHHRAPSRTTHSVARACARLGPHTHRSSWAGSETPGSCYRNGA